MQRVGSNPKLNFSKGIFTESAGLTFPTEASVDELNMDLLRDGSRRRRLGLNYETSYDEINVSYTAGTVVYGHLWKNAGSVPNLTFAVVQTGNILRFFDVTSGSLSSNLKGFTLDMNTYNSPYGSGSANARINVAQLRGALIVASSQVDTFKIEYNATTDTISSARITFRIRDFEWQSERDLFSSSVSTASVTEDRKYDTMNCGWRETNGTTALNQYIAARTAYPALTHPWYSGKNSSGSYSVSVWETIYSGSSLIGNGSFVLDLYMQDRRTASGLTTVDNYIETTRFTTVATWAGRVFYAGMSSQQNTSRIYFSQIADDLSKIGELYQQNDPTAEEISDVLATDGGFVEIPEAYNILRLHVLGPTLMVFAENGVWSIRGVDNVFKATDYAVSKISDEGLTYADSFVSANGRPFWWSTSGVFTLRGAEEPQVVAATNLSIDTIQTLYNNIVFKDQVRVAYDAFLNRVFWVYPDNAETVDGKLRNILIFDERLGAFVPWKIADASSYILDVLALDDQESQTVECNVVDSAGNEVVDASGNDVIITRIGSSYSSTALMFITTTATSGRITFSQFQDIAFKDFTSNDYNSYLVGSYDFMGDMTLMKNVMYIHPYFSVTETEVVTSDGGITFTFNRPSSCTMTALWDFKTTGDIGQEAYRLKSIAVPTSAGPFVYPSTVLSTKLRVRGRGRVLQMKFNSNTGKDFYILGYDMIFGSNSRP